MTQVAAFFDLDGTLLSVNSGRLWIRREWRAGRITPWQLAQAVFYMAGYGFGVIDMERAMVEALRSVEGLEERQVREATEQWYQDEVRQHAAPGAFRTIEEHRRRGHLLVILTSSSPYEAEAARRHFRLDHALSTRYEVRDGRFTGGLIRPVCFAAGKIEAAELFAAAHDLDLDLSYFYSDSVTDVPMLERVGFPRVVQPDFRLRRIARRRRWPVLDWS